ncbi:STAS domain-containing protein [Hoyosella subflava]|uniref:Anti-sigma factor antagonist n=1 Tax=Hoyosella subflava (strain DSM 45089 / JCM 17490 / NBRC 109087 / DQS3-9A1) TaxID=443218 RepID=F6ELZ0_HOYSD|nr:STAS domain-containing protein [Hoyosella subflava]AEF42771.1 Anti-sigma factor antagonist [Hoyosella subflava DQS3-9A1]
MRSYSTRIYATAVADAHVSAERTFSGAVIIRISGEIDATNALDVWSSLAPHLETGGPRIFDLTGITFLGVSGAEVLLRAADRLMDHGTRFATVGSRAVRHLLCAAELDEKLNVMRGVSDAVHKLSHHPTVQVLEQTS